MSTWEIVNMVVQREGAVEGRDASENEAVVKILDAGFEPYAVVPWDKTAS